MKNTIMLRISNLILTINCHGSSENFINPLNPITHLMINLLKKIKGKKLNH
jgi:hypothetical protein